MKTVFIIISLFLILSLSVSAEYIDLPKDEDGWTIFTPSSDTRIVYVSNDGDDSTGQIYSATDFSDPFNPSGEQAFATYEAAFQNTRDGYPDWILIRRGDVFYENINRNFRNGRSVSEPFLVSSYGNSGLSPVFKTGSENAITFRYDDSHFVAFSGLDFYAHTRNPDDPEYINSSGNTGLTIIANGNSHIQGILFEGVKFRFYLNNAVQALDQDTLIEDVVFRRCLFLDDYSDSQGHSQGLYSYQASITLDECIFDHNGWLIQQIGEGSDSEDGQGTMFNHNTYFTDTRNTTIKNTIFSRPSSIHNKFTANNGLASARNIMIENNLYIDGEVGLSIGGNTQTELRFKNITVSENVFTDLGRSRPTNRDLGWYIDVMDWDGGVVENNYLLHQPKDQGNNYAFNFVGPSRDVDVRNNVVYGIRRSNGVNIGRHRDYDNIMPPEDVSFYNNILQFSQDGERLFNNGFSENIGMNFYDNIYYSDLGEDYDYLIHINTIVIWDGDSWVEDMSQIDYLNYPEWQSLMDDNSVFEEYSFPDSTRSIETYQASLGKTPSIDAFIDSARMQDRYNWSYEYTATVVNAWIKEGFAVSEESQLSCGGTDVSCGYEPDCQNCNLLDGDYSGMMRNYFCESDYLGCDYTQESLNDSSQNNVIVLNASRISGVAPLAVHFDTVGTDFSDTDRDFHHLDYSWNFGDDDSLVWRTTGKRKNRAKGPIAAHVYEEPGTYSVTLTVKDMEGKTEIETIDINVLDPDDFYSGTSTTCVSDTSNNDFTGCPAGARHISTDDLTTIPQYADTGSSRILFRRSSSWILSEAPTWQSNNPGPVTIGAYGTGKKPHIQLDAGPFLSLQRKQDWRIMDIKFTDGTRQNNAFSGAIDLQRHLFLRLEFEQTENGISWSVWNDATPLPIDHMAIVECNVSDTDMMSFFVGGERLMIMGNNAFQTQQSHIYRVWYSYKGVLSNNLGHGASTFTAEGDHALKFHANRIDRVGDLIPETGNVRHFGDYNIISDNIFGTSGPWPVNIAPQNAVLDERISEIIFERNRIISDYGIDSGRTIDVSLHISARNVTVRNNIFDGTGSADSRYIAIEIRQIGIEPSPDNVEIYHNSIYRGDSASYSPVGIRVRENSDNIIARNNLASFPFAAEKILIEDYTDGNLDASANLITDTPGFINPDDDLPLSRNFGLLESSSAIDQGEQVPVYDDFVGNSRLGGVADIGAFEYDAESNETQHHSADTNQNGIIDLTELNSYVNNWKTGSSISLSDLIEAVDFWKNG
ncbi:MAG: PKD domain-containing protein [Candidatus Woesearchaeota archaeon]